MNAPIKPMLELIISPVFNVYMEHPDNPEMTPFDHLEAVTTDPVVTRIFDTAREYEQRANTDNLTAEEIAVMTNDLNEMWPYMQWRLQVSGRVMFGNDETQQEDADYCDDTTMVSNGFCFDTYPIMHDDEVVAEETKVGLLLIRLNEAQNIGEIGTALPDDVAIEYPFHSTEMVENRLRYFHPEVMKQVDSITSSGDAEEQMVKRLSEVALDTNGLSPEDDDFVGDLQTYLTSKLDFDKHLPYSIKIEGDYFAATEDGLSHTEITGALTSLARIVKVRFVQFENLPEDQNQPPIPCIEAYMYSDDKTVEPAHMFIPSTSIQDVVSIRKNTYSGYQ